ncbi:putative glycogen debranching enzyme [Gregarina niphandrodes]|uniref:Glycogen debranching enzyme n=1 Tax=Gregarina niphandrodes TaxID=110365 RepID=A0A023AYK6_GRENI|nr:putative glycogen debranching enzyme [Gregarina niphandrodes]EZG43752.1 putative glycogen debranching enzyme [Gregarina niphandrodes]|eukprot:XP_011134637.1 putative glycogen debranching enzyme [Gregarina niphandrodes]
MDWNRASASSLVEFDFSELPSGQSVYRVQYGCELRVRLSGDGSGVEVTGGDGSVLKVGVEESFLFDRCCKVVLNRTGPTRVVETRGDGTELRSVSLIVEAKLGGCLVVEDTSVCSVISQRLGTVDRWEDVLRVVSRQGFNGIHFTPVQVVGESKSSYSIADHLTVSDQIACNWAELDGRIQWLKNDYGIYSLTDIVLNHMANNAPFLRAHPEAGYNQVNAPWLKAAIELDILLRQFTKDIVDDRIGISRYVNNESDIDKICQCFEDRYFNRQFNLREWLTIDVEQTISCFRDSGHDAAAGTPGTRSLKEAVYESVGESRNFVIPSSVTRRYAKSEREAREQIAYVQQALWSEGVVIKNSIMDSMRGTLRYERLQLRKGPIEYTPWNSVVPWYFTPVEAEDGQTYYLAHNGWVMGWGGPKGFIERGSTVYLRRSLIAWSDCVKLNYGTPEQEEPEHSPALWELMRQYAELSATHFHGFRLDNCHTTPLAVAKYVLQAARRVRPELFVFAELFTGSEKADIRFEQELGIDCLVREAIQTTSPGDQAWHAVKYARCQPFGSLDNHLVKLGASGRLGDATTLAKNYDAAPTPQSYRAANMFYDCTHDNETCTQKNRPLDTLACAAIVCASGCSVGSTFGYEMNVKTNPSVIADGVLYGTDYPVYHESAPQKPKTDEESRRSIQQLLRPSAEGNLVVCYDGFANRSVVLMGAFNSWSEGLPMAKVSAACGTVIWTVELPRPADGTAKFVVDGAWRCSEGYPKVYDNHGNENNNICDDRKLFSAGKLAQGGAGLPGGLEVDGSSPRDSNWLARSCGVIEGRRVLNKLHSKLSSFTEIEIQHMGEDMACISRYNPASGEAYHFFVRSAWWMGRDQPDSDYCAVKGKVVGEPLLCAAMDASKLQDGAGAGVVTGLGSRCGTLREVHPPRRSYDATRDVTHVNFSFYPPGSVCVLYAKLARADSEVVAAMEELDGVMESLSLSDVNYLMWSCDPEERDRSAGAAGVYMFPDTRACVYAGVMGAVDALAEARRARASECGSCGIYRNVREGDWLLDYHASRVCRRFGEQPLGRWWARVTAAVKHTRQPATKTHAVEVLFGEVHRRCVRRVLNALRAGKLRRAPLGAALAVAATQVVGEVPSACLDATNRHVVPYSTSAGLPFFTTEYMREWGRDTLLSVAGLSEALQRWDVYRTTLLAYARVLRHGMIPNLLDSSTNPRYNARDAVHFWLCALQRFFYAAPEGSRILDEPVALKYHHSLTYELPFATRTVKDCVRYVLYAHYHGIAFREWNAGERIDSQMTDSGFDVKVYRDPETGFCLGGNRWNCGTWMDKMGSSAKAGNKGHPSSPRDGAPVELTLALYHTLCWVSDIATQLGLSEEEQRQYNEWKDQIRNNFAKCYVVTTEDAVRFPGIAVEGALKDVYGGEQADEDFFLRCNYSVGLALCPRTEILPPGVAKKALEVALERLVDEPDQVGMKTLNKDNYRFRANYDNANDTDDKNVAHGWNYHQGPEWVWPYGCWFEAYWTHADGLSSQEKGAAIRRLTPVARKVRSGPWYSLPEVTDRNGGVCQFGCQAQAWSIATFLSFFNRVLYQEEQAAAQAAAAAANVPVADNVSAAKDSTKQEVLVAKRVMVAEGAEGVPTVTTNGVPAGAVDKSQDTVVNHEKVDTENVQPEQDGAIPCTSGAAGLAVPGEPVGGDMPLKKQTSEASSPVINAADFISDSSSRKDSESSGNYAQVEEVPIDGPNSQVNPVDISQVSQNNDDKTISARTAGESYQDLDEDDIFEDAENSSMEGNKSTDLQNVDTAPFSAC